MTIRIKHLLTVIVLLPALLIAGTASAAPVNFTASAVVLSKNQCRFLSNNFTLDFGNLDPVSGANVTAAATVNFRCQGSAPIASYAISDDDGLNETGPNANRMQSTVNPAVYIPYTLTMNPLNGNAPKNTPQTLTVNGTIAAADYQFAIAGPYTDMVVISILP